MSQEQNKPLVFYQIKRIFNEYPTAIIDIISEFYSWNSQTIKEIPVINWEKISCNENIHWDYNFFNQFRDKLNADLLSQNKGFLSSPDFITIFKTNCDFFNLNLITLNIGNPNIRSFFKEILRLNKTIDYSLVTKNWTVYQSNRLKIFLNDYIPSKEFKLDIKTQSIDVSEKSNLEIKENTLKNNHTINSVILSRINNHCNNTIDVGTIKCDDIIDLHNYLIKHPIDFIEFRGENFELTKDEIFYLNNIPLSNEIFIRLVDLNKGFFNYFKYNKYLQWDQQLFEQFDDLYSWWNVGELPGNYLTEAFLIKNVSKIVLTQEIFEKIKWTMPLIYTLGWEQQFQNLFKDISPDYYESAHHRDFFYINLDIGNLAKDVLIHYYPLLYKNYIESNLALDLEIIFTDLNKLQNLESHNTRYEDSNYHFNRNTYIRSLFCKKLGHVISVNLTTPDLLLILESCSEIIHSYYQLPRIDQFYCAHYKNVKRDINSNSSYDELSRFYPGLLTAFREESETIFNDFFISHDSITKLLNSDIIYIKNSKIANIKFISLFKNLKYLLLNECNIEDTNNYNFVNPTNIYLRKCKLSNFNFIYSFPNLAEFYFINNKIKSQISTHFCNHLLHLQTLYLENHRISELNINNNLITKLGISDYNYKNLKKDLQYTKQLDKLESFTIKWTYKYRDKNTLMGDVYRCNIFKFNLNYEIIKYLKNLPCKIQNLCLVNLYVDSQSLKTMEQENCNICIFQDYMQMIYVINHDMPKYNSIDNLLFDTKTNNIEEYEYFLEHKRFSDSIHEMLLCDENQNY